MSNAPYQLDKRLVRNAFERAAASYDEAAVLQHEVGRRLVERLEFIRLEPGRILDLGAGTGRQTMALMQRYPGAEIVACDLALNMLLQSKSGTGGGWRGVCGDADALPFGDDSFDLIYSNLTLQWCLDIDHTLTELRRALRPGGLLLYSCFGPDTLWELRHAWAAVDSDVHVNAFVDLHNLGDATAQAGFQDPVLDSEHITLTYSKAETLMRELKAIGAHNVTAGRPRALTGKQRLRMVIAEYEQYRRAEDGLLPATYDVIYGAGWNAVHGERVVPVSQLSRLS